MYIAISGASKLSIQQLQWILLKRSDVEARLTISDLQWKNLDMGENELAASFLLRIASRLIYANNIVVARPTLRKNWCLLRSCWIIPTHSTTLWLVIATT